MTFYLIKEQSFLFPRGLKSALSQPFKNTAADPSLGLVTEQGKFLYSEV